MILATTMNAGQWVLIGLVLLLVIAYPVLMSRKNKKENQRLIEQTNSLKRGDKILTTSGVYGTILEVREEDGARKVVIETGNAQYKSYMTVDAYAIYTVFKEEPKPAVEKKEEVKVEEKAVEEKPEIVKEEVKKPATKKKTTTSKAKKETK